MKGVYVRTFRPSVRGRGTLMHIFRPSVRGWGARVYTFPASVLGREGPQPKAHTFSRTLAPKVCS